MLLFLPISLLVYFSINRLGQYKLGQFWLTLTSLAFYGYWNISYLPLILTSILFNYFIGTLIHKQEHKKIFLCLGIAINICVLGYFKYTDFLLSNLNIITDAQYQMLNLILPLGISFFTFTHIAYLVETYKGKVHDHDIVGYSLFVTYFPHLLAGPIIHYEQMQPQFTDKSLKNIGVKKYKKILHQQ